MNRREFIRTTAVAAAAPPIVSVAAPIPRVGPAPGGRAEVGAYYLNANMYTVVPRQVREDMEWMADHGTHYLCPGVLEQDLWSAHENLALIVAEATRVGMKVLAVPSRWGGLTAGAPKVPSMFSVLNPHTWIHDERGRSAFTPYTSGVVSSVHWPETLQFWKETLTELYRQHPAITGLIIDEPKAFRVDYSPKAAEVLGANAPRQAHIDATANFYDAVCRYAKERYPEKATLLFTEAHHPDDEIEACAKMKHLDYFGADGRPWNLDADRVWIPDDEGHSGGKGKILLDGRGAKFRDHARANGKKSFFLIENHNLPATMMEPMDRFYPEVLALGADLYLYYYYPRNVQKPDRAMEIIGNHIRNYTRKSV